MAFFKEAPIKSLTRDRDLAKANCDRLALKLHEAEANVIATKSLAQRAALDGDDGGLDAAEAAERAALHRHGTLSAAHAESEKLLALLESQLETMADQKLRAATRVAALALADELIEAHASYDASTSALNEVCSRVLAVTTEANGLVTFLTSSLIEVAAAVPVVGEVLKQHARAVLNGSAKAEMPTPEKPFVAPVEVQPVTTQVFVMKQVRWTAAEGQRFAPKYAILDLPPDVADRALALKACTPIPGPEWAAYKGTYSPFNHHAEAINLDAEAVEGETLSPTAPPYGKAPMPKAFGRNSDFVETIGAPRLMRVGGTS
jgi:hypothetical protein